MDNNEFFKISSGLKSLIGAELITDIYVAIFELVKNSFDAKAQKVTITFNNLYSDNEPASITIEDDGLKRQMAICCIFCKKRWQ